MAVLTPQEAMTKWPSPQFKPWNGLLSARKDTLERLRTERSEFLEEWRDISDFIQIRRGKYLTSEQRKKRRTKSVLNETATFASRTLGAGMLAGISSPSRPWLKLATPDPELNQFQGAKRWLDVAQRQLYRAFQVSNYYYTKQAAYRDMGDFGQGPMIIDEDYENAINCVLASPGEYFIDIDSRGIVVTLYREFKWSVQQCLEKFGYRSVSDRIRQAYDRGDSNTLFEVVHAIQPNRYQEQGARGVRGMPYSSVYFDPGASGDNDNGVMEVKGYHENPISSPRWDVQNADVYGDGPGSLVLSSVKSLQTLEKRKGQLIDKLTHPNLALPASMKRELLNHNAGQPTYFPDQFMQQGSSGRELYRIDPTSVTVTAQEINVMETRINTGYFTDLFLMLEQSDRRQITAREIDERHEEKLLALGPVLERTHYEGLNREVNRTFGILRRAGVVPPPPPELDGVPLKVEYTSLLATAQRSVGVASMERFAGFMGNLSAGNPAILDKWDMDQTVDEYADLIGVPASTVRSDQETDEIRKQREKQEQSQQAMATAAQGAQTAQVLSQTDTSRGGNSNLLADILGGNGP